MEIKKEIPAELLRKYEQIKGAGRGIAVVAVWKEICDGCHMAIPPQMYNELQKEKALITCPNCNRIIYWENRNGSEGLIEKRCWSGSDDRRSGDAGSEESPNSAGQDGR